MTFRKKHLQKKVRFISKIIALSSLSIFLYSFSSGQSDTTSTDTAVSTPTTHALKRVAILPFDNLSGEPDASKRITNIFLTQLFSKNKSFEVIELGEVEKALIEERVRNTGEIEIATAKKLGEKLQADYLILGSVVEYKFSRIGNNDLPIIGVTSRAIDTQSGLLIWSSHEYGRGNQREKVFGIGRIVSLSELSEIIVKKLVDSFEKKILIERYMKK